MTPLYARLIAYDDWANAEVLRALRAAPFSLPGVRRLGHLLAARELWLARLAGEGRRVVVWPESTFATCAAAIAVIVPAWSAYLAALDAARLATEIEYTNSKGEPWKSRVEDVLLHVALHGAYHRGQIALDLRALGAEPAYTDFIHAARTGRLP